MPAKQKLCLLTLLGCSGLLNADAAPPSLQPNLPLFLADDFGEETVNLSENDKKVVDQLNQFFEAMSPAEQEEFMQASQKVAEELDDYVTVEAQKMGMSPTEYFEKEFLKNFAENPVLLAQNGNAGGPVSENSFQLGRGTQSSAAVTKPEAPSPKFDAPPAPTTPEVKPATTTTKTAPDNQNSGNWLKKNYYLQQARLLVDDAQTKLQGINTQRKDFYAKLMREVDVALNKFFQKIGAERGNFNGIVEYLEAVVGQKLSAIGLIEKEATGKNEAMDLLLYQTEEKVESLKFEQQALKNEMESLVDLDKKAMDQIEAIDKHINSSDQLHAEILSLYDQIDQTYSHKQAYEFYNKIDANADKISAIHKYLYEVAPPGFNKIKEAILTNLKKFEERINKMVGEANALLEKLEKNNVWIAKNQAEQPKAATSTPAAPRPKPARSWLDWLLAPIEWLLSLFV